MSVVRGHTAGEIVAHNAESLNQLVRSLLFSQGDFSLILVRCNYVRLRNILIEALQADDQMRDLQVVQLAADADGLRVAIQQQVQASPRAVFVTGLETVKSLTQFLASANQIRDSLRQDFAFPIVLWVNDHVLQTFNRTAPDLKTFAPAPIQVGYPPGELLHSLHQEANRLFQIALNAGSDRFLPDSEFGIEPGSRRRYELEFALSDIQAQGEALDAELQASLDFVQARDAHANGEMETARRLYEQSLAFWQARAEQAEQLVTLPNSDSDIQQLTDQIHQACHAGHTAHAPLISAAERYGCLLFYLGLWWRSYAVLQRSTYRTACEQARRYFVESLTVFQQANRLDVVARYVLALAEVLQKLGRLPMPNPEIWHELEEVSLAALELHALYDDPIRRARDRGFLAEIKLIREEWKLAIREGEQALALLDNVEIPADQVWIVQAQQGWYHYLIGAAQIHLRDRNQAIKNLEIASQQVNPRYDLTLYRLVLDTLHDHYYDKGSYHKAFQVKQQLEQVESSFGLRAFIGAVPIQPWQSPSTVGVPEDAIAPLPDQISNPKANAIVISSRQQDVDRLLARIEDDQYKLTVIHGQSGVGKSSILKAGLIPRLNQQKFLKGRRIRAIALNNYVDWPTDLTTQLNSALPFAPSPDTLDSHPPIHSSTHLPITPHSSLLTLLNQNHFLILIFDQFEEFFFEWPDLQERRAFWQFLSDCINQPFVNVILSLREDYLHYLLECERLTDLEIINNDILSRDVRYYLGNFSRQDARTVIETLTQRSQFELDADLVDALVADLSVEHQDVRPIELQVVGAQLQREEITTLAQYRALGDSPKQVLVEHFLHESVQDCGRENQELANLILFFLTEEGGIRPQKTREELETDVEGLLLQDATERDFALVLEILVGSGLVFEIPAAPEPRYQLVHDYLVDYIRQQQSPGLVQQLKTAQAKRQEAEDAKRLADERLNQVLQKQLTQARRAVVVVTIFAVCMVSLELFLLLAQP
ncbi:MAG: nSTAND1 domain-containing NTPase [Thainema sp.]